MPGGALRGKGLLLCALSPKRLVPFIQGASALAFCVSALSDDGARMRTRQSCHIKYGMGHILGDLKSGGAARGCLSLLCGQGIRANFLNQATMQLGERIQRSWPGGHRSEEQKEHSWRHHEIKPPKQEIAGGHAGMAVAPRK